MKKNKVIQTGFYFEFQPQPFKVSNIQQSHSTRVSKAASAQR